MRKFYKISHYVIMGFLAYLGVNCTNPAPTFMNKSSFGFLQNGQEVYRYTLNNSNGMSVSITDFGATIVAIEVPDRDGTTKNVVLGYDHIQPYLNGTPYFGSTIGRYANRIREGRFELDGESYQLSVNDGDHHLHGGSEGFDNVLWTLRDYSNEYLEFSYLSADGEMGYPGNLEVRVRFSLTQENELKMDYWAQTDASTPVNLTNHAYFNLSGEVEQGIFNHQLQLMASAYTPVDEGLIPTGEITEVEQTLFDFRTEQSIGERLQAQPSGFDHNFVLDSDGLKNQDGLHLAAKLTDPLSGRQLEVWTTEPGIQFYSGNFLDGTLKLGDSKPISKHGALCLETQHFPNSPNEPAFPSTILHPGEEFRSSTIYGFKVVL